MIDFYELFLYHEFINPNPITNYNKSKGKISKKYNIILKMRQRKLKLKIRLEFRFI